MIKRVILVPHTHTDLGYTELAHRVAGLQNRYLLDAAAFCENTVAAPAGESVKWSVEALTVFRNCWKYASSAERRKLLRQILNRNIELTAFDEQVQTQLLDIHLLDEEFKYARILAQELQVPIETAVLDDIGGFSWNLPQLLRKSGMKYYSMGVGAWRVMTPIAPLPHLFRYRGVDGASDILVYLPGLGKGGRPQMVKFLLAQYGFGVIYLLFPFRGTLPGDWREMSSEQNGDEMLMQLIRRFEEEGYPYDTLMLQSGSDNAGLWCDIDVALRDWNQRHPELRLELGTFHDFFAYIEARYDKEIPVIEDGEITCSWSEHVLTHGYGTIAYRNARHQLLRADMLWHIFRTGASAHREYLRRREQVIQNMKLFCDHTFGMQNWKFRQTMRKTGRIHSGGHAHDKVRSSWYDKQNYAVQAQIEAQALGNELEQRMIQRNSAPVDWSTRFCYPQCPNPEVSFVNPLPYHSQSGFLEFYGEYLDEVKLKIGRKFYPCERVQQSESTSLYTFNLGRPLHANEVLHAKIFSAPKAPVLPENFALRKSAGAYTISWAGDAELSIDWKSGSILSYRVGGRELQDSSCGTAINDFAAHYVRNVSPTPTELGLTEHVEFCPRPLTHAQVCPVQLGRDTAILQLERCYGKGSNRIVVESEYTLRAGEPQIYIRNRVRKITEFAHECGHFIFPFRIAAGQWRLLTGQQGYIHDYRAEKAPGAAWENFAFQDFAVLQDNTAAVHLVSAQAIIMSVGQGVKYFSEQQQYDPAEKPHLYMYCYNNLWETNTPAEQLHGDLFFDFTVTPLAAPAADPAEYFTLSRQMLQPAVALGSHVRGSRKFLQLDDPGFDWYFITENGVEQLALVNMSRSPKLLKLELNGSPLQLHFSGSEIRKLPLTVKKNSSEEKLFWACPEKQNQIHVNSAFRGNRHSPEWHRHHTAAASDETK